MGDMADAQRVVCLNSQIFTARRELVPFERYEPFRAALPPTTFKPKPVGREECLAQAEDCRAIISTASDGGTRIRLENMARRWERLAEEPQRTRG